MADGSAHKHMSYNGISPTFTASTSGQSTDSEKPFSVCERGGDFRCCIQITTFATLWLPHLGTTLCFVIIPPIQKAVFNN